MNYHPEYHPACAKANARIAELEAENERIDSFDGHLDWLHEHYPETTFDGSSGDLGAVNVVLSRKLMQAEAEVAEVQALRFDLQHKLDDARSALAAARDEFCTDCEWLPKSMRARTEEGEK